MASGGESFKPFTSTEKCLKNLTSNFNFVMSKTSYKMVSKKEEKNEILHEDHYEFPSKLTRKEIEKFMCDQK